MSRPHQLYLRAFSATASGMPVDLGAASDHEQDIATAQGVCDGLRAKSLASDPNVALLSVAALESRIKGIISPVETKP